MIQLEDVIKIKHGFAFKGEYFVDEETEYVLVTPGNFSIGGGFKSDKLKYYNGPVPNAYKLKQGDIIVTMTDLSKEADTLGYSAKVPRIPRTVFLHNQRIGLINLINENYDIEYIYWVLRTYDYQRYIAGSANGATVKHTSPSKIGSYKFNAHASLPTQRRIASILSAYDHLIENNLKRIKLLEELARRTYEEWFVKFRINGKILDKGDFEIVSLRSLLKDTMNGGWGKENEEGSYNKKAFVLRGTDMPELAIGSMLNLPLRFHTEKNLEPRKLLNGDIVIELSNGNINNIGRSFFFHSLLDNLFEYPVMCASFCKLLRPLNEGNGVLAYLHINHIYKNNSMFVYKAQGANGINNFQVEEMIDKELIPVPKGKSLNKLTDNIKCALQMINTIRIQNHHLKTSRDILLPRLMNGKIIVE